MFYLIHKVDDHPCYNMQGILEVFFKQLLRGDIWDINNQHKELKKVHQRSNFVPLLESLYNELAAHHVIVRCRIYQQFINNNQIEKLCNNTLELLDCISWDESIGKKIKALFLDCYPSKLDLGIFKKTGDKTNPTKKFYQEFIALNGHICPFCSILPHKHPFGRKRSDFDHYMDKAHYPLAALNMDNLIPMCTECNQDYKHTADILKNNDGIRRAFLYPYSLKKPFSIKIESMVSDKLTWEFDVSIVSDMKSKIVSDFENVFNIKDRMQRELNKRYDAWLMEEAKRYTVDNADITIYGFKESLLNTAEHVIDLNNRTLEAKLLEQALYLYLGNTDEIEINDIFLGSYLFDYLEY